jgi:hypothetical protein
MKKHFLFFAMLASVAGLSQNVAVEQLQTNYSGGTPTVKFRVAWTGARTYRHNIKVWVFVDYKTITNNAPMGDWTRAAVASTPTVSSSPASSVTLVGGNNQGFWLHGADGNYSATLTVPLSGMPAKFNWCAYVTVYPPHAEAAGGNSYTLHGSPPFVINGTKLGSSVKTYSGTITALTDATGAPGIFPAAAGQPPNERGCATGLVEYAGACVAPSAVNCNSSTLNLGTVSFSTTSEITIVGNGISQIWSRPVTATGCQKTTYNGGVKNAELSDCRNNPSYDGYLFSGCAVALHSEQLCPPPWRVPLTSDFINLDIGMGGNGTHRMDPTFKNAKYIGVWGAQYGGIGDTNGVLVRSGDSGWYSGLTYVFFDAASYGWYRHTLVLFRQTNDLGTYDIEVVGGHANMNSGPVRCVR